MGKEELPRKRSSRIVLQVGDIFWKHGLPQGTGLEASKSIVCLSEVLGSRLLDSCSWSAHVSLHSKMCVVLSCLPVSIPHGYCTSHCLEWKASIVSTTVLLNATCAYSASLLALVSLLILPAAVLSLGSLPGLIVHLLCTVGAANKGMGQGGGLAEC